MIEGFDKSLVAGYTGPLGSLACGNPDKPVSERVIIVFVAVIIDGKHQMQTLRMSIDDAIESGRSLYSFAKQMEKK